MVITYPHLYHKTTVKPHECAQVVTTRVRNQMGNPSSRSNGKIEFVQRELLVEVIRLIPNPGCNNPGPRLNE